jgi:two-component system, sensor histidine kinase
VRVLVIDDQPDVVVDLCALLGELGLECRGAPTGLDALRVANDFSPELIFLDIGLPDISGYEVAKTLRERGCAAYIVALTGWGRARDVWNAFDAGFDFHLLKPANQAELEGAVVSARERRSA